LQTHRARLLITRNSAESPLEFAFPRADFLNENRLHAKYLVSEMT
jgi:hypothetical protein